MPDAIRRGFGRHGWLWKECRELAPVVVAILLLLGLFVVSVWRGSSASPDGVWQVPAMLRTSALLFTAALFGSLAWGVERLHGTSAFALSLPLRPVTITAYKGLAAAATLVALAVGARGVLIAVPWLVPPPTSAAETLGLAIGSALVWVFVARLSLIVREPLASLGLGVLALLVIPAWGSRLAIGLGVEPMSARRWTDPGTLDAWVVGGALLVVLVVSLWRATERLEHPSGELDAIRWRPAAMGGASWLGVEWRQKGVVWATLALLPLAWPPLRTPIWALIAGAIVGALLFTRIERDGLGCFVHQLPVRRTRWVARRLLSAAVFGAVVVALLVRFRWADGPELSAGELVTLSGGLYVAAFAFGAMLSPWLTSTILASLLAVTTAGILAVAWHQATTPRALVPVLVAIAVGLAWWSAAHSRALEPASDNLPRALALVLPFWLIAALFLWR